MAENIFVQQQVHHLYKYINIDDNKYVLFSKTTKDEGQDTLLLGLCDGYNTFTLPLTSQNIQEHYSSTDFSTDEQFLTRIKTNIENGDVSVNEVSEDIVVYFGAPSDSIALTFRSSTAAERKQLLRYLFFEVVEKLDTQEQKEKSHDEELAKYLKEDTLPMHVSNRVESDGPLFLCPEDKRRNNSSTQVKSKVKFGDSIVNPGTKKRKKATGVVFDDDT